MGNSRRLAHIGCVYLCLLYLVLPLTVEAARKIPVVRPASAQDTFVKGAGTANQKTLDIDRHWGEVIDVPPGRTTLPVTQKSKYNFTRIKGILKNSIKLHPGRYLATAAGAYLLAQMPDADWDGFKLQRKTSEGNPIPIDQYGWVAGNFCQGKKFPSVQALSDCAVAERQADMGRYGWTISVDRIETVTYQLKRVYLGQRNSSGSYIATSFAIATQQGTCPPPAYVAGDSCLTGGPTYSPFAEADYDKLVSGIEGLDNSHWGEIGPKLVEEFPASFDGPDGEEFTGPPSYQGQPTTTTTSRTNPDGSTSIDLSEKTTRYDFNYNTNPTSITLTTTTTTNNYTNGVKTGTTTETDASTKPEEQPKEKIDCELMPTHCKWIDWTKEPPPAFEETDLPVEDVDKPASVSVGPSGSCPPPKVISGEGIQGFKSFEFKFDPVCDLFSILRPIVIGVCSLVACFILAWRYN